MALGSWLRSRLFVEVQLAFPFIDAPEGASPVVSRYRRRLRDVSDRAYRLGAMRAENRRLNEPTARSLGAAVVEQMLAPVIVTPVAGATKRPSVALSADDRNEIARLARAAGRQQRQRSGKVIEHGRHLGVRARTGNGALRLSSVYLLPSLCR